MITQITNNGEVLAIIVPRNFDKPGIHFFTPDSFSQQLAYMHHPAGQKIDAHVHTPVLRDVHYTLEVLMIKRGKLRVDFFDGEQKYLESRVLEAGDVILLAQGGHGFEVLEELEMFEVKQGPYAGDRDKTRFNGILPAGLQITNPTKTMSDVFQQYSKYYDLLYRDKDYAAEVAYVVTALRASVPAAREILEFGSGTGRHGRLLAEQGYDVFGVERSETMAAAAKRVGGGGQPNYPGTFDCIQGDVRSANAGRIFDAVLSLFHVVSYQTTNEDLLQNFSNAARHLRPGGVFLFDVWHGPAVLLERPALRVKRVEDEATLLTRIAEPELNTQAGIVTVRYTMLAESKSDGKLVRFGEEHHMRYLFPTEIGLLARQTGFAVERSEEFLTGAKPSEKTWGVAYLLRKQK